MGTTDAARSYPGLDNKGELNKKARHENAGLSGLILIQNRFKEPGYWMLAFL